MENYYNNSHCADLTAATAIDNVTKKEKADEAYRRGKDFLGAIIRIANICGYDVIDFIVKDRRSGKLIRR